MKLNQTEAIMGFVASLSNLKAPLTLGTAEGNSALVHLMTEWMQLNSVPAKPRAGWEANLNHLDVLPTIKFLYNINPQSIYGLNSLLPLSVVDDASKCVQQTVVKTMAGGNSEEDGMPKSVVLGRRNFGTDDDPSKELVGTYKLVLTDCIDCADPVQDVIDTVVNEHKK